MRTIEISKLGSMLGKSEFARRVGKSPNLIDYWVTKGRVRFLNTANGKLFYPEDAEMFRREYEEKRALKADTIET